MPTPFPAPEHPEEVRGVIDALRVMAQQSQASTTAACLDEEWIAAFAEGGGAWTEPSPQRDHLLACPRCRDEVASVARLLADASVAAVSKNLAVGRQTLVARRVLMIGALSGIAAAAALVFMAGSGSLARRAGVPAARDEGSIGVVPPTLLGPKASAGAADSLRWTSVPRADQYRVTVFDLDSAVWDQRTRDTVLALPAALTARPGAMYRWRIAAHVGWEDRWVESDLGQFTIHQR